MPNTRKPKNTRRRRRTPGRNVRRTNVSFVRPQYISGPPNQQLIKFIYNSEQICLSPVSSPSSNWATHFFRTNSLHDPDATSGTLIQPRFWDQYKAIYDRYRVLGCKIEVEGIVETAGVGVKVFICPLHHAGASYTNYRGAAEQKRNVSVLATDQRRFKLSRYMSTHAINNVKQSVAENDEDYSALQQFNPVIVPQFQLGVAAMTSSTNFTVEVCMKVTITYYTKLYQIKPVTTS